MKKGPLVVWVAYGGKNYPLYPMKGNPYHLVGIPFLKTLGVQAGHARQKRPSPRKYSLLIDVVLERTRYFNK